MEKNKEKQILEENLKIEIKNIVSSIRDLIGSIGQIEINKYKIINSNSPDAIKIGELECLKNTLIVDAISMKQNFKEKIKQSLKNVGIPEKEIENYSIDLSTGEIKKQK